MSHEYFNSNIPPSPFSPFLSILTSVYLSISEVFTVTLNDLNSKNKFAFTVLVFCLNKFKLLHAKQLIHIQIQISCVSEYKCYKEAPVNQ